MLAAGCSRVDHFPKERPLSTTIPIKVEDAAKAFFTTTLMVTVAAPAPPSQTHAHARQKDTRCRVLDVLPAEKQDHLPGTHGTVENIISAHVSDAVLEELAQDRKLELDHDDSTQFNLRVSKTMAALTVLPPSIRRVCPAPPLSWVSQPIL